MKFRIMSYLLILLMGFMHACSSKDVAVSETPINPGWHQTKIRVNDLNRVFRYYIPGELDAHAPVVILLHGGTRSMKKLFRKNAGGSNEWPVLAEKENFVLLVPNGTNIKSGSPTGNNQQWNDCRPIGSKADDVEFIAKLISWVSQKIDIDKERIYVTGISNGGLMAYRLADELNQQIAAVAVFVANEPKNSQCKEGQHPMPIMIVNGTADSIMPYDGGGVNKGKRGNVLSTTETIRYWLRQNKISEIKVTIDTLSDRNHQDMSRVVRFRYGGNTNAPVVLLKIVGGGHLMPSIKYKVPKWVELLLKHQNNDIEGARLAWKFLSRYTG